jgi:purine-binding chemotaxis protein CheW
MSDPQHSYLVVRVSGSLCALPVAQVIEILRPPSLEAGSQEVPALLGFITLRGQRVAVLDLAVLLALGRQDASAEAARLVSVRLDGTPAALHVDEVIGLQQVTPGSLRQIDLPAGNASEFGRFDEAFARLIATSGLLTPELLRQTAGAEST